MKKLSLAIPTLLMLLMPFAASAHEHASYLIGGTTYNFVIGSLNEPVAVDDKTGLDLAVTKGRGHGSVGTTPVTGLEETLKVELVAGKEVKSIALKPSWGQEGVYEAAFYPTKATTFGYRLTGTIEGNSVDLTFTCTPGGEKAKDDTVAKEIAPGVTRISMSGSFGCPAAKENLGFPEKSASIDSLIKKTDAGAMKQNAALALGAIALAVAVVAMRRKR